MSSFDTSIQKLAEKKTIFFLNFRKKGAQGDAIYILNDLKEDETEEVAESSSSKCPTGYTYFVQLNWLLKLEFSSQPISEYWNRTTTLIPFL